MPPPDPLAGTPWSTPGTVAGFARAAPNEVLLAYARRELPRAGAAVALDLGCGAGRNAVPLARLGFTLTGLDLSWPMLSAGVERAVHEGVRSRVRPVMAPMDRIPMRDQSVDLVIAHGIWNLAGSTVEFRRAVREAARVARPGAGLFVFTFSRHTFARETLPVAGEAFVFTEFSGRPQCFLTESQLVDELAAAGFVPDSKVPLTEYNRPQAASLQRGGPPVIYEAAFRRVGPA
jgi:SAM-dependent methyltransferase